MASKLFPRFIILLALGALILPQPAAQEAANENPFFKTWTTPFKVPPFDQIKDEHYLPAFKEGIKRHQAEIDAIVNDANPPTLANTLAAFDRSGELLTDVALVFYSLLDAETNPELQNVAREAAPILSAHQDNIILNEKLFARVKALHDNRQNLSRTPEESYLLEKTYRNFIRNGALLSAEQKARLRELNEKLSLLSLKFGENLLNENNALHIAISDPADLAGLPESVKAMGAEAAKQLGMAGKWIYTVRVPSMIPFLQYAQKRPLREQLHRAYIMRGDRDNASDNKETARQIASLRAERARLLGYPTHAHFIQEEYMSKNPDAVNAFLKRLWTPALERSKNEAAEMQAIIDKEKGGFPLASWDWWYYAEKLRQEKYAFDDTTLRPYFSLENVKQGVFILSNKLYGLQFVELKNMPVYNPEVQVYEVREAEGSHVGVLYMDFHPRPGKRGGAWSGTFRGEYYKDGKRQAPIANLVCNFTRPTSDTPSLLSIDEVGTFFHEFGHALNSLLDNGFYRTRNVPWDSVELPSQIMENWVLEPELLNLYARHWQSNEAIPEALVEKLKKSSLFNQGFETVEYLAASILDMAWHTLKSNEPVADVRAFEKETMDGIGLIPAIVPRYRTTYFNHIFNSGYSAGYYSYIWAGVLDKDAFEAFKEKGLFDKATAAAFRKNVLERLGTEDAMSLYVRFRGAEPKIEPLLRSRGLLPEQN